MSLLLPSAFCLMPSQYTIDLSRDAPCWLATPTTFSESISNGPASNSARPLFAAITRSTGGRVQCVLLPPTQTIAFDLRKIEQQRRLDAMIARQIGNLHGGLDAVAFQQPRRFG